MEVAPLLRQDDGEAEWLRGAERARETRVEIGAQPYDATAEPFRFAGEAETSTILTLHNATSEEELRRLATHDALTGVYNTRHFDSVLSSEVPNGGTLAFLDVDHFKPINDELGHAAGDAALMTFTGLVRHELRPTDVFARLGGDEFAVFFPRLPVEGAIKVMEAIHARLERNPFRFQGAVRNFSASIGIAAAREHEPPESLKRRADKALYEAKRRGRGRWVVGE